MLDIEYKRKTPPLVVDGNDDYDDYDDYDYSHNDDDSGDIDSNNDDGWYV